MSQITKSLPSTGNINPYPTSLTAQEPALALMDAMKKTNEVAISDCCKSSFNYLRGGVLFLSAGTNFVEAMKILRSCGQEFAMGHNGYDIYFPDSWPPELVAENQKVRHSPSRMFIASIIGGGVGYLGEYARPSFEAHICPLICPSSTNSF